MCCGLHHGLVGAGARADEASVGAGNAHRDMAEHSDRALPVQHARQGRGLFAQRCFVAHEKQTSVLCGSAPATAISPARAFDQVAPAVDLRGQKLLQLGGRLVLQHWIESEPRDQRLDFLGGGDCGELLVQPVDDRLRRGRRRADQGPADRVIARHAGLRDRRNVGNAGTRDGRAHAQRAHLAGGDLRAHAAGIGEHQRDMAGHHVVERRRRAAIGDAVHLDAGHGLEQLGGEMDGGARAAVAEVDFAGLLLGERDQFGHRLRRHARD